MFKHHVGYLVFKVVNDKCWNKAIRYSPLVVGECSSYLRTYFEHFYAQNPKEKAQKFISVAHVSEILRYAWEIEHEFPLCECL